MQTKKPLLSEQFISASRGTSSCEHCGGTAALQPEGVIQRSAGCPAHKRNNSCYTLKMMDQEFQLRAKVYAAATDYYRAHGNYLVDLRQDGDGRADVRRECMKAGEAYSDALKALLKYLISLLPQEPHKEAIRSAEHLLAALKRKLELLQPGEQRHDAVHAPQPTKRKQLSVRTGKLLPFPQSVASKSQVADRGAQIEIEPVPSYRRTSSNSTTKH